MEFRANEIHEIILSGRALTIEQVVAVARFGAHVVLSSEVEENVNRCRDVVDVVVEKNMVVYGINTGFGALRDRVISAEKVVELQQNLIRSHACGVGDPFPSEVVRAAILLRANTLARGNSGIRLQTLMSLIDMLHKGICACRIP